MSVSMSSYLAYPNAFAFWYRRLNSRKTGATWQDSSRKDLVCGSKSTRRMTPSPTWDPEVLGAAASGSSNSAGVA